MAPSGGARRAFATLVYDGDSGFVAGACALGRSVRARSRRRFDLVALVAPAVPAGARARLAAAGWRLRGVAAASRPAGARLAAPRLAGAYAKLALWNMTDYDVVASVGRRRFVSDRRSSGPARDLGDGAPSSSARLGRRPAVGTRTRTRSRSRPSTASSTAARRSARACATASS